MSLNDATISADSSPAIPRERVLNRRDLAVAALLAILAFAVFVPALGCDFINLDDLDYVVENAMVGQGLSGSGVAWAFTTFRAANWHPLTWLSLMLDAQLWGVTPMGFHLTNVLLHALSAGVVYLALTTLVGDGSRDTRLRAAFASALFALHPLRVESVVWVAERKDVLSTLPAMAAILCYAIACCASGGARTRWHVGAVACFALSLLAKPMYVTLPCVLMLLDVWPLGRGVEPLMRRVTEKWAWWLLVIASCVVTMKAQSHGGAVSTLSEVTLSDRLGNAVIAYARYLRMMAWPSDLAVFYPWQKPELAPAAGAGVLLAAVTALVAWRWRAWPWLAVGWLWFLGSLVPVIGLVQVGWQALADRYTYFPMIGVALILAWSLPMPRGTWSVRLAALGACALVAALAASTRAQIRHWQNSETLMTHAIRTHPQGALPYNNLGLVHSGRGEFAQAIALYEKAISLSPTYWIARMNYGTDLDAVGRTPEAVEQLRTAVSLAPGAAVAWYNLGIALGKTPALAEAEAAYLKAIEIDPAYGSAHHNLGLLLSRQGKLDAGLTHLRAASIHSPRNVSVWINLGVTAARAGKLDESIGAFRTALELQPTSEAAVVNLAMLLASAGRTAEALRVVEAGIANGVNTPRVVGLRDALSRGGGPAPAGGAPMP